MSLIIYYIYIQKSYTARWDNKKLKQFNFTLLDGSYGFHITESIVSISYTFHYHRALVS
jgi:hypothetical protein